MPRLFVAFELPATATAELARIQPPPTDGVRLVEPHQMHVTLYYIGEAEVAHVAAALTSVPTSVSPLMLEGVGQFLSAAGAVILWAGVQRSTELLSLHAAVATALGSAGLPPEVRTYIPHVTLARCEPGVAREVADEFLARHAGFSLSSVLTDGFRLCSSEFSSDIRSTVSSAHSSRGSCARGVTRKANSRRGMEPAAASHRPTQAAVRQCLTSEAMWPSLASSQNGDWRRPEPMRQENAQALFSSNPTPENYKSWQDANKRAMDSFYNPGGGADRQLEPPGNDFGRDETYRSTRI